MISTEDPIPFYTCSMPDDSPKNKITIKKSTFIVSMGIGIALGTGIGAGMDNLGVGLACGITLGGAIMFTQSKPA